MALIAEATDARIPLTRPFPIVPGRHVPAHGAGYPPTPFR